MGEEEKAELERKAEEARTKLTAAKLEAGNVTAKLTALRAHMDDKTSAAAAASTAARKNSLGTKLQALTHVVGAAQKAGKTRREVNVMKSEEQKAESSLKASQDEERRQHIARLHKRLSTRRGLTESEQKRAHDAALESARSQRAEEEAAGARWSRASSLSGASTSGGSSNGFSDGMPTPELASQRFEVRREANPLGVHSPVLLIAWVVRRW